jgi:hypothetical protein
MRFFDETVPYWGNTTTPLIGSASARLTARSVKIFADGINASPRDSQIELMIFSFLGALRTGGSAVRGSSVCCLINFLTISM